MGGVRQLVRQSVGVGWCSGCESLSGRQQTAGSVEENESERQRCSGFERPAVAEQRRHAVVGSSGRIHDRRGAEED